MKSTKKFFALLTAFVMILTLAPSVALAITGNNTAETEIAPSSGFESEKEVNAAPEAEFSAAPTEEIPAPPESEAPSETAASDTASASPAANSEKSLTETAPESILTSEAAHENIDNSQALTLANESKTFASDNEEPDFDSIPGNIEYFKIGQQKTYVVPDLEPSHQNVVGSVARSYNWTTYEWSDDPKIKIITIDNTTENSNSCNITTLNSGNAALFCTQTLYYDYIENGKRTECQESALSYIKIRVMEPEPRLAETTPTYGDIDFSIFDVINFKFENDIYVGDNIDSMYIIDKNTGKNVDFTSYIRYNNRELVLSPKDNLAAGHTFMVYLPAGAVKNIDGLALEDEHTLIFTTRTLEMLSSQPSNNADRINTDEHIEMEFDNNIYRGSAFDQIKLINEDTGANIPYVAYPDGKKLMIYPTRKYDYYANITAHVPYDALLNYEGTSVKYDFYVSFKTVNALYIESSSPYNNEKDIAVDADLSVTFDDNIAAGPNIDKITITDSESGNVIPCGSTLNGNTLTVHPYEYYRYYNSYKLNIPVGALLNSLGFKTVTEYNISFTTMPGDLEIVSSNPTDGSVDVSRGNGISVTFTYPIYNGLKYEDIRLNNVSTGYDVEGSASIRGRELRFTPRYTLDYDMDYEFIIPDESLINGVKKPIENCSVKFRTLENTPTVPEQPLISVNEYTVTISGDSNADIYYTLDGSAPAVNGILYTEPFKLDRVVGTVRAVAVKNAVSSPEAFADFVCKGMIPRTSFNPGHSNARLCSVKKTSDNGYIVAGSYYSGNEEATISKLDADGNVMWTDDFGGKAIDVFNTAVETIDGGYVAVGFSDERSFNNGDWKGFPPKLDTNSTLNKEATIIKYSSDGIVQWKNNFGGWGYASYNAVIATADGGVLTAGRSESDDGGSYEDYFDGGSILAKYNANGELEWRKFFDSDEFNSIIAAPDGGYTAVGYDKNAPSNKGGKDAVIMKFDSEGNSVWAEYFGGLGDDELNSVIPCAGGGYVAVGGSYGTSFGTGDWSDVTDNNKNACIIIKFDNTGQVVWKNYITPEKYTDFSAVASTSDGGYVAVGNYTPPVKFDESGALLWQRNPDDTNYLSLLAEGDEIIATGDSNTFIFFHDLMSKETFGQYEIDSGTLAAYAGENHIRGEEFTVPIYLKPSIDATAVSVTLKYPEQLTYVDQTSVYKGIIVTEPDENTLQITGDFSYTNPMLNQQELCLLTNLRFTLADDCPEGTYEISFVESNCGVGNTSGGINTFKQFKNADFSLLTSYSSKQLAVKGAAEISVPSHYRAEIYPKYSSGTNIEWSVSDPSIAVIDKAGMLTPSKSGKVTVTAVDKTTGARGSLDVTIKDIKTYINSILAENGKFAREYGPKDLERILYIPKDASEFALSLNYIGGIVTDNEQIYPSGSSIVFKADSLPGKISLIKKAEGFADAEYKILLKNEEVFPTPRPLPQAGPDTMTTPPPSIPSPPTELAPPIVPSPAPAPTPHLPTETPKPSATPDTHGPEPSATPDAQETEPSATPDAQETEPSATPPDAQETAQPENYEWSIDDYSDGTVNITAPNDTTEATIHIIVAKYDAQGILLDCEILDVIPTAGANNCPTEKKLSADKNSGEKLQVFIWDDDLRPLAASFNG